MEIEKRQIQYNIENLISRIPGLFTFMEDGKVLKGTLAPQGCYGKYVCDLRLGVNVDVPKISEDIYGNLLFETFSFNGLVDVIEIPLFDDELYVLKSKTDEVISYQDNTCLEDGTRVDSDGYIYHSYRTLIYLYHKYKFVKELYNSKVYKKYFINSDNIERDKINEKIESIVLFINFIDYCIGCYTVEELVEDYNLNTDNKNINFDYEIAHQIPSQIYLATSKELLNEMKSLQVSCEFYNNLTDKEQLDYNELCCDCQKFHSMGGYDMIKLLEYCSERAEVIADELYHYTNKNLYYNIQIPIKVSMNEMGVFEQYRPVWDQYKGYENGEIVYYNGNTHVCIFNGEGLCYGKPNEYDIIEFPEESFSLIKDLQQKVSDNEYYEDENISLQNVKGGNYFNKDTEKDYKILAKTNSRLKSLRRLKTFNENGKDATPNDGYDWLFYYRIGVVDNKKLSDRFGNPEKIDIDITDDKSNEDVYKENLQIYGNIIDNIEIVDDNTSDEITYNSNEEISQTKYLQITYTINAHLKPQSVTIDSDEEGNKLVYYRNLIKDCDSDNGKYHGLTYVEKYNIPQESELNDLINGDEYFVIPTGTKVYKNNNITLIIDDFIDNIQIKEDVDDKELKTGFIRCYYTFDDYVNGKGATYEYPQDTSIKITLPIPDTKKYEFYVNSDRIQINSSLGKTYYRDIISEYEVTIENNPDYEYNNLYKEDYLMGIHYQPYVKETVNIDRGNADAFETHLKLMEIKTMQDLENYQNGGFFKIEKMN